MGSFGSYQIRLCLTTQFGYVTAAVSLLCTTYLNLPPKGQCFAKNSNLTLDEENLTLCECERKNFDVRLDWESIDFYSLLMHLKLYCATDYIPTLMTTCVMGGGVVGAFLFGHIADQIGRRSVCLFTLTGLVISDLLMMLSTVQFVYAILLFFVGLFTGAYMVTNITHLLENVGYDYRLLCVCLNGWPFGNDEF